MPHRRDGNVAPSGCAALGAGGGLRCVGVDEVDGLAGADRRGEEGLDGELAEELAGEVELFVAGGVVGVEAEAPSDLHAARGDVFLPASDELVVVELDEALAEFSLWIDVEALVSGFFESAVIGVLECDDTVLDGDDALISNRSTANGAREILNCSDDLMHRVALENLDVP